MHYTPDSAEHMVEDAMNAVTDIPTAAPKSGNVQLGPAAAPASTKRPLYFQDPFTDLAFLFTLSKQAFKGSEIGECYSAAAQIREGDVQSWREAWSTLAEKVEALARSAEAKGHRVSARQSYLRAVTYYRNVLWGFRASDPGYRATLEKSRVLFKRFAALSEPPIEFVEIPYEGTVLPGYFLRPDASGKKRPTVIIGDNASEELYYWIGPPALERGYNALLVDLPGIGLNSFNGLPFRFDSEVPVKAVIDYLCARSDVDPSRIAAYGGGEGGGYIVTRAAAHEHRIAACVADPLVFDMEPIAPLIFKHVLPGSDSGKETLASNAGTVIPLIWGLTDPETIKKMKVDTRAISCPTLALNDSHDYPELLQQARAAAASIADKNTAVRVFTAEDGSNYRQVDNFGLKHRTMFDWLDDVLNVSGDARLCDLVQAFTAAFTSDDVESFYKLIAPEAEWVIMATGETFRGLDQIKQLTVRSVAARTHGGGLGIKPTNIFTNADGSELCWEYMHTGVVTEKWPASSQRPAPGTKFELPIILVGEIREGKIIKMREYFDLLTLTEAGTPHRLYS
jgi:ketosteroid isomerase-like protein/pimeloyl-ACP methyl ester carboxylesterase